jgi:hypothetical protein
MPVFNRVFIGVLALAWCAVLAVAIWLVWDQARFVEVNDGGIELMFDVTLDRAEQILATIVLGALALPALALLFLETRRYTPRPVAVSRADDDDRVARLQDRIESLERRLVAERSADHDALPRESAPVETAAAPPTEPVEMPGNNARSRRWRLPTVARH